VDGIDTTGAAGDIVVSIDDGCVSFVGDFVAFVDGFETVGAAVATVTFIDGAETVGDFVVIVDGIGTVGTAREIGVLIEGVVTVGNGARGIGLLMEGVVTGGNGEFPVGTIGAGFGGIPRIPLHHDRNSRIKFIKNFIFC
jgi:hypothetical protein